MPTKSATPGIGGVWLDNEMYWTDEYAYQRAATQAVQTIDGGTSIQVADLSASARPMTLQGGWHRKTTIDSLNALMNVVGATYVCTFRNSSYTVVPYHDKGPAVQMQFLVPVAAPASNEWMQGSIRLLIVG